MTSGDVCKTRQSAFAETSTESFNISVCAALSLFYLTEKMRADSHIAWQLDEEAQTTLKLYWCMQVIHDGRRVMEHLMKGKN